MRSIARHLAFFALLATVAAACSDSNDPADDDDDDISRGTMQGSFGHSGNLGIITFVATTVLPSQNSQSVSILAVDASGRRFTFTVNSKTTGSYTIGPSGGGGHQAQVEVGSQVWNASAGSTGTITISSVTTTTMSGTVSVVLQPAGGSGATGTMTVALTFSGTFGQT